MNRKECVTLSGGCTVDITDESVKKTVAPNLSNYHRKLAADTLKNEFNVLRTLNGKGSSPTCGPKFTEGTLIITRLDGITAADAKGIIQRQPQDFLCLLLRELREVHSVKVAHGDLSSTNILVVCDPKTEKLVKLHLVDFGFASTQSEFQEEQIFRGTIPFASTLAQCGVLACFPADLESCFALALWASMGTVPWDNLQEQIKYLDSVNAKLPTDPLVQLLLASSDFIKSDLLSFNLESVAASQIWELKHDRKEQETSATQQVVSVSKEEARWHTEICNGVKRIGIGCGENYLVKVCKADPAWQLEVGLPRAHDVLHKFRKFRKHTRTKFDLLGGSSNNNLGMHTKLEPMRWDALKPMLRQCASPIIIGESTRIKVGEGLEFCLEDLLVKLELRATLLQFLCDAYDPRTIHGIRIVLALRTHNETLFETAAGFIKTAMATQAFRYGRLNFLMARGQFDIICDMESISRTSELARSLQQLTGDETDIRQEIAKAQQRANEAREIARAAKERLDKDPNNERREIFWMDAETEKFRANQLLDTLVAQLNKYGGDS